jgi:RNA polymerase sigma factor (sigma-70 family)
MNSALSPSAESLLTQAAFDRLLECLDANRERAGEKYEVLRLKLIKFFEWRACAVSAIDLADETLNRVARRIDGGEELQNLSNYAYGVARLVYLEKMRRMKQEEEMRGTLAEESEDDDAHGAEQLACFERCLRKLSDESRELIVSYYQGQRRAKITARREIANRLGIPLNALRIRAHRIRLKLEQCVLNCLNAATASK